MRSFSKLKWLGSLLANQKTQPSAARTTHARLKLSIEQLESRVTPAVTVSGNDTTVDYTNTNDTIVLSTDANDPTKLVLDAAFSEDYSIAKPAGSLTLNLGGANLVVNTTNLGSASLIVNNAEKATVSGNLSAGNIYIGAQNEIDVSDGANLLGQTVRTSAYAGTGGLTFRLNTIVRPFGQSWSDDGFFPGEVITIDNTNSRDLDKDGKPDNDGQFVVTGVSGSTLTVDPSKTFASEYQVTGASITGVGGNVALSVDAAFNLSFDAAAPVVRDREAAGKIAIGNAHLNGNNVFVLSNSNTQKFADFEVNTFGLDQVNLPASMTANTFPVFVDNLINPQTGQTVPDTIVRADGNWLAEGFRAGDYIQVSNSQFNNGIYRIAALNESTLTLDASAQLKPENGTSDLTIETVNLMTGDPSLDFVTDPTTGVASIHRNDGVTWASQGFEKGQTLSVKNTPDGLDADTQGDNDGEYPIMDVNGEDLILDLGNAVPGSTSGNPGLKLVPQTGVHGAVITSQGSGADIPLARLDETVVVQPANVQLTFADNGSQPDTITRATGNWGDEHFGVGQSILVKGTRFNDNTFTIAAVSSDGKTLTLSSDDELVNETIVTGSDTDIQSLTADEGQDPPTLVFNPANNSITRKDTRTWRQDGFQAGQTINVNGTASNDGPNQIASISPDGKTLFMASFINMFEDTEATPPPGVVDVVSTGALAKPELSFTGNTITRSSGSWSDDGFTAGGKINIDGSADNNGQFTVTSITNNGRTLVIDLGTKPDNTPIVFADEHTLTATVQGLILLTKSNGVAFTAGDLAGGLLLRMAGISDMLSGFIAQATTQQSTSEITVADGATLNATQDLGLRSMAQSTLNAKIQSLWLGVSYGKSEATSRLIVGDNTKITAGDTVGLNADVFNTLYVGNKITTGANFPLLAAQRVVLDKAKLIPGPAFTAAAGEASSVSETRIGGPNSFISGSIVNVSAKNLNDFTVETKGKVNGIAVPNTGGAAAIIVSKTSSSADATLSGTVHATGQLNLDSRSVNVNDDASGTASVKRDLFGSNDGSFAAAQKAKVASALASKGFDLKGTADAGKVSGAAALTIANSTNEASSLVTGDARLYSKGDVSVTSYAEDNFNASAIAAAKANSTVALAGAIIISNYDNESNATVADGAVITAAQNLNVHADSVVPNQVTLDDAIKALAQPPGIQSLPTVNIDDSDPFKASQSAQQGSTDLTGWSQDNLADNMAYLQASILPLVKFSRWVPDFLASTDASASAGEIEKEAAFGSDGKPIQKDSVKGKLGLDPETRVVSQADYAISGTVKAHQVHNTAHATVGEGVKLNINLSDLNPATPFVVSPADTQKISVTANTSFESIDLAGIAKLGLNKSEGGSVIGGSYSGITLTNEAIAYVDDGAQLKAKGDIEVKAANRNWDLAIGQQGGKASVVGVNGAVTIYRIDNNVQAYIEDQAKVDSGGTLTVNANDDVRLLNVNAVMQDGGVLAVGIGVSINSLEHTTHAFIGNLNTATNSFPSAGSIHAAKAVDVNADSETKLLGIGLAKTAVKGEEPDDLPADENGEKKPVPLKASKLLGVDDTTQQGNAPQFGLGISANVALNFQKDDTQAFIRGTDQADGTKHQVQLDPGGVVSVTAESNVFAIAVTASILTGSEIAPAGALSGAFTWNSTSGDELDNPDDNTQPRINRAYIADTTVTADQVKVNANTNDFSVSVTAGVGAVKPTYVANIAGSGTVSVNDSQTESFIGDPTDSPTPAKTIIRTTGDVDVEAKSDNFLVSVTGAVTVSGKVAVGAALDVGLFDNAVNAYIGGDADVKSFNPSAGSTPGNVTIHAESDQTITTVGAAVSLLASTLALPFTINTQNFNSNVTSYIGAGAIVSAPNVYVTADEDLRVTSVSGTAAFGASKAGVGLALGLVDVERNVQATVNPGAVVTANGTDGLKVLSNGVEKIVNAVASGTGGQQISATVSPAFTQLAGAVKSTIVGSNVTASGVDVDANSAPLIFNLAIAGSVAVAKGPESGPPPSPGDAAKAQGQPFRPLPITFAGAGAGSGAYIRNDVQALVINSTVNATGAVSVEGHDHSSIYADAGGLALAFRLGSQASVSGVNGTIGASVAINDVQSNTHALIQNSTVNAHDDVHLLADASPKIQALTVAGAGTVSSGGNGFSVNFAGAGAGSGNNVKNAVDALIAGSNVTSTAADVILEAYDKSTIHSDAGAVAVSLSLAQAGKANVNMSVGASAAVNQVRNAIQAAVEPFAGVNSNVTAASDVRLTSQSTSKIDTLSIAGALSATIAGSGGGVGANFVGAGTGSANDIANTIDASITGGTTMAQQGKLAIGASDDSTIHADAGAVAVALSIASQNRVGVQGSVGASIGVNDISNATTATAANASIQANGDVSLTADEDAAIDAVTIAGAGSVAAGTGTVGVSFAGAGAGSANQISNTTKATLSSDSHVASTTGGLNLSSSDDSTIKANSTGAALAVSAGSQNSAAITVGVAVALNDIHNTIQSVINGSNDVSSHQSTKVTSDDSARIDSVAVAATLSVAAGAQNGVAVSGGGAVTKNTIGNTNNATIKDSTLVSGGGVTVSAQNNSADSAKVASVSVAGAFGANGAAGVAVGIGVATNDIANTVAGIIDHSTVNSGGPVAVSSTESSNINALTIGAAVAVGGGGAAGVGVGAAGAGSGNTVKNTVQALIQKGATVTTTSGDVTLSATDSASITANGGGVGVSVGAGGSGGGVGASLGVSFATNDIEDTVQAIADQSNVTSAGQVGLTTNEMAT
ncbi:beta strand repeat-containing protein, partial [Zavarzinella formosa]|uniref:beta strand repeat-containing protein n=1 Tax=Zavarzinella formosa TaxID=360055 RepID=UPI0012FCC6A1